jgi:ubiquinone/menaquinone biosynthesis C-methylase UbiE
MDATARTAGYVLGHSTPELTRLQRQAEVYRAFTRDVLVKAGIAEGQSVLDVGCGVGDVSFAAARLVGASGRVRGIDRSPTALDMGRRRAASERCANITFDRADIDDPDDDRYDAITGRFILLHQRDPGATLRGLKQRLRPGGVLAFIEMDLTSAAVFPPMPLFTQALGWIAEVYARDGFHTDMGSMLYGAFRSLDLEPTLSGTVRVEGGPDAYAYEYIAETVRSLLPRIEALGIADPGEVAVDTLAERIRETAVSGRHCFFYPRMIGAFARNSS